MLDVSQVEHPPQDCRSQADWNNHYRRVRERIEGAARTAAATRAANEARAAAQRAQNGRDGQTAFDRVLRGSQNYVALKSLQWMQSGVMLGPLYLFGGPGVGKSTIAEAARECSGALVMDDAHLDPEGALKLLERSSRVILTSIVPVNLLADKALAKRLRNSTQVEIGVFDAKLGRALAERHISELNLTGPREIPPRVLDSLLASPLLSGHLIVNGLKQMAKALDEGSPITDSFIQSTLCKLTDLPALTGKRLTVLFIQRALTRRLSITVDQMKSHRRDREVTLRRHQAMALCHRLVVNTSLPEIGRRFDRDHTSVLHALRRIERLEQGDAAFRSEMADLEAWVIKAAIEDGMER